MNASLRRILATSAILVAACAAQVVQAQDTPSIAGTWTGTIDERLPGAPPSRYEAKVHIAVDRQGRAVGTVHYDIPCQGLWSNATRLADGWRFEETITDGHGRCAPYGSVEVAERGGALDIVWRPIDGEGRAAGTLHRPILAADTALPAPAQCDPYATGILHGQARDQWWYLNNDPITVGGERYVKYGLPRVLSLSEMQSFARYQGAHVFVERGMGPEPEVIYLLIGGAPYVEEVHDCEYQPYLRDRPAP